MAKSNNESGGGGNSHDGAVAKTNTGSKKPSVEQMDLPKTAFHESNLFWGSISIAIGIVLTVVAAMMHDIRWLLIFAWVFFALGIWRVRNILAKFL